MVLPQGRFCPISGHSEVSVGVMWLPPCQRALVAFGGERAGILSVLSRMGSPAL